MKNWSFAKPSFLLAAGAAVVMMTSPQEAAARSSNRERPSCSISFDTVSAGFILSGSEGQGAITCKGKRQNFTVIGGSGTTGFAEIHAIGSVYRLNKASDFAGVYGQVEVGGTVGQGQEYITLMNEHGVVIRMKARTQGLALNLGGSAIIIKLR